MYIQITLLGRLGRDPELKYLPDGAAVCSFDLACEVFSKGEKITRWFKVSTFGDSAEAVNRYCSKGSAVLVYSDDLNVSPYWSKKSQEAKAVTQINARRVIFAGGLVDQAEPQEDQIPF